MKINNILMALAATGLVTLAACNSDADIEGENAGEVSSDTLAAVLQRSDDLTVVSDILGTAGLQGVFDGNAPYTIFAPTDAAFSALDIVLDEDEARAAHVAIVREHIVPGFLSRADIEAAIGRSDGSVEMQTMGTNTLAFSMDGDDLVVTSSDGTQAEVSGDVMSGANGSVIPVDTVLKAMDEPR